MRRLQAILVSPLKVEHPSMTVSGPGRYTELGLNAVCIDLVAGHTGDCVGDCRFPGFEIAVGMSYRRFDSVLILDLQHGVVPYNLGLALALEGS